MPPLFVRKKGNVTFLCVSPSHDFIWIGFLTEEIGDVGGLYLVYFVGEKYLISAPAVKERNASRSMQL